VVFWEAWEVGAMDVERVLAAVDAGEVGDGTPICVTDVVRTIE
jgi:hypothetical protein